MLHRGPVFHLDYQDPHDWDDDECTSAVSLNIPEVTFPPSDSKIDGEGNMVDECPAPNRTAPAAPPSPTSAGTVSLSDSDEGSDHGMQANDTNSNVEDPKGDCSHRSKKRAAPVHRGKGRARGKGKKVKC